MQIASEVFRNTHVGAIAGSPWKNNEDNAAAKLARDTTYAAYYVLTSGRLQAANVGLVFTNRLESEGPERTDLKTT